MGDQTENPANSIRSSGHKRTPTGRQTTSRSGEQVSREKTVLLCVTGSIAAYKSILVLRQLQELGMRVRVIHSAAAANFVGSATWEGLTGEPPACDIFARGAMMDHIFLADQADLMLICPASANTLATLARGQADSLIAATYLAAHCPVLIAPAMNVTMWQHPATRRTMELLLQDGCQLIAPAVGKLACGWEGEGRLPAPEAVTFAVRQCLTKPTLQGRRLLITAGATREYIDPVRFLSNPSTGRMGVALAIEASLRGATVDLVAGEGSDIPAVLPENSTVHTVRSAADMFRTCEQLFGAADWFISAAAVADWTTTTADRKQKKTDNDDHKQLSLQRTTDILATLSQQRRGQQKTIGFAAETHDLEAYGRAKLERKKLDAIICNPVDKGRGFGRAENEGILLCADGSRIALPRLPKEELASRILTHLEQCLQL